ARQALSKSHAGAQALGALRRRRLGELEQIGQDALVRRAALLRLAREQGVQDAHPRALVALPRVYALRDVPRHAVEGRGAPLEGRRPVDPRHDADADGEAARALQGLRAAEAA